jgi:hypothetical protein
MQETRNATTLLLARVLLAISSKNSRAHDGAGPFSLFRPLSLRETIGYPHTLVLAQQKIILYVQYMSVQTPLPQSSGLFLLQFYFLFSCAGRLLDYRCSPQLRLGLSRNWLLAYLIGWLPVCPTAICY